MPSSARTRDVQPTFETVTDSDYIELLTRRLHDDNPLTWITQAREILESDIQPGFSLLDVGCATGYASKMFRELQYLGVDVEETYLDIARQYFAGIDQTEFLLHDFTRGPIRRSTEIVIVNAVLEHCPSLSPVLDNILASASRVVLVRTFLGDFQQINTVPSPKPAFAATVRKFSNQYAFADLFKILEQHGFQGTVIRDRYTDSMPRYVDKAMRTFYFVKAKRISKEKPQS